MVARKFGVGIDLGGKQAKGMVLENLASDNEAIAKEGSVYFNTTDKKLKIYQDSAWEEYATKAESDDVAADLADEIDRAEREEARIEGKVDAETARAEAAESDLQAAIEAEGQRAEDAETALGGRIDDEISDREDADTALQNNIDAEELRATTAESALDTKIEDETARAEGVENTISTDLRNLGISLWHSYATDKTGTGTYFDTVNTLEDGSYGKIWNENSGGGIMYYNKTPDISSFVGVNKSTNSDKVDAQIYAKNKTSNLGTRINISATEGMFYLKNTVNLGFPAEREVAVLQDLTSLESDIDDKLDLKADKATTYTKDEIDAKMSSVYDYKGTVKLFEELEEKDPAGNKVGDVYNVKYKVVPGGDPEDPADLIPWGMNFAWVAAQTTQEGTIPAHWDELGEIIDLSPYAKTADVAATYETIANCNTIRGRLDALEADVAELQSDVAALQELTALQPKIHTYTQASELSTSNGTATWIIDYHADINHNGNYVNDVQVTVKEISTGEEITTDITQSTGQGSSKGKVTISFETDANIPANTYKAIIVG